MISFGKQIFFTPKSLKLSVGKNILIENLPELTFFDVELQKLQQPHFLRLVSQILELQKISQAPSGHELLVAVGIFSISLTLPFPKDFQWKCQRWCIQVFLSSYDCQMYAAVSEAKPCKHAQQVLPLGNGQCQVMAWPEHTCGDRVHLEECSSASHLRGCNTLCPFYLAGSLSDVQRADLLLWQGDSKLHRKDYDKAFPPCTSEEILFAMVSFAMCATLILQGVMKCKAQHPVRGHHWKTIARWSINTS